MSYRRMRLVQLLTTARSSAKLPGDHDNVERSTLWRFGLSSIAPNVSHSARIDSRDSGRGVLIQRLIGSRQTIQTRIRSDMQQSKIDPTWPNALRWFLVQRLTDFAPWHLMTDPSDFEFAARAFEREDVSGGSVFVFAGRQDREDFAGLLVVDGRVTDQVICFHPVFGQGAHSSPRSWNIVCAVYDDVFDFFQDLVIPDMKDWANEEDASELLMDPCSPSGSPLQ